MITQPQTSPVPDPYEERLRIQTARLLAYRDDGPLVMALRDKVGPGLPRCRPRSPRCSRSSRSG